MESDGSITQIEAAIKDLDLDYMRGLVSEDEYRERMTELKQKLVQAGGTPTESAVAHKIEPSDLQTAKLYPRPAEKKVTVDPVTAVRRTVESMRKLSIERIAQESGIAAHNVMKILSDLLDGRELSGRIDHDSGDFILGTGTGPAPKTIHGCPYCRAELDRVAVKGETITCSVCKESFIIS